MQEHKERSSSGESRSELASLVQTELMKEHKEGMSSGESQSELTYNVSSGWANEGTQD